MGRCARRALSNAGAAEDCLHLQRQGTAPQGDTAQHEQCEKAKYVTKPNQATQQRLLKLTISTLNEMLTFATTVNIQRHIIERTTRQFRSFEAKMAELEGYGLASTAIIAIRNTICQSSPLHEEDFFKNDIPLGSHELGAYINQFPLDAAATSYLFTLLEVFGNNVADLISPGGIDRNKAWHEDVKGFADLRDEVQIRKARGAFAKHFKASGDDVSNIAARRTVALKRGRNEFAHKGQQRVDFEQFLRDTLAVVCHILFLTTDENRISVYPWEDHFEIFRPQFKA